MGGCLFGVESLLLPTLFAESVDEWLAGHRALRCKCVVVIVGIFVVSLLIIGGFVLQLVGTYRYSLCYKVVDVFVMIRILMLKQIW